MSYKESKIVFERAPFWVFHKGPGHYQVYKQGITHSTICGIFHFRDRPEYALELAKADCQRRAAAD